MKILADENIPRMTVEWLRTIGHDVKDLRGTPHKGLPDTELWALAIAEWRMLVTTDKGFTEYRDERHHGILIVRLRQPNRQRIHNAIVSAIKRFPEPDWPNLLVVLRDRTISTSRGHSRGH
jgi:predicted nuclease of predicted toxin-antitoxin system